MVNKPLESGKTWTYAEARALAEAVGVVVAADAVTRVIGLLEKVTVFESPKDDPIGWSETAVTVTLRI